MIKAENSKPKLEDLTQLTETERLKRDIYRPDMEKFQLFTQMLRTNAKLKKAVIHHKIAPLNNKGALM
jgi:hypothetical protein